MQAVTTIGLDIAKSVFQIHGVDAAGNVIVRRQLKRRYILPFFQKLPPCLVGIEACFIVSLVTRAQSTGTHCAPDAAGLREALRQTAEE
jgi:transposase